MRMFERFDVSEPRVRAFASKLAKIPGFIRTAPYPSDQLKLFSASAVERHGVAFSLDTFFWQGTIGLARLNGAAGPKGEWQRHS